MAAAKKKTSKKAPVAKPVKKRPVAVTAKPKAAPAGSGIFTAHTPNVQLLTYVFVMLSIIFLAMTYYRYS
jgi:hypothetical protein